MEVFKSKVTLQTKTWRERSSCSWKLWLGADERGDAGWARDIRDKQMHEDEVQGVLENKQLTNSLVENEEWGWGLTTNVFSCYQAE